MFLRKVYRYNKWLCGGMLFFAAIQLFCFYKGGMVFSPWYNYGMYSEVIKPQPEYALYKVYAGGKIMAGNDYSPQQWDAIHFTLVQATAAKCNEHFYKTEISRLFQKFHLSLPSVRPYINVRYYPNEIMKLYPARLAESSRQKHISVIPLVFEWNGVSLVEKDSLKAIPSSSFLCK